MIAYLAIQMHITIAFAVLLNPAFYIAERLVLGMHQQAPEDVENGLQYQEAGTPVARASITSERRSKTSFVPVAAGHQPTNSHEAEVAEYRGANAIKYVVLRVTIVVILVVLSIIFRDHFSDFADFVGASAITAN